VSNPARAGTALPSGGSAATVHVVNEQEVRSWRMRPWPNDPTIAHLVFVDHADVPSPGDLRRAIDQARRRGVRAIRTSALFPQSAEVVLSHGFDVIDRLALLTRPLSVGSVPEPGRPTRPLLPWQLPAAAAIDRDAFGPSWGNDTASLRDIRRATPRHRARTVRNGREMTGFAISGAAGDTGYLQRIAVAERHRRQGFARDLVADSLRWMSVQGLSTALVNTGIDNQPALDLYDRFGFRRLDHELTIAEFDLRAGAPDPDGRESDETAIGSTPP
jgi:ribosomal protein S18 acetylase RimI-like enzyme